MVAPPPVVLGLHDIAVGFGSKTVLSNINLEIKRGSIFAIMGGSGCGKSTILKVMIGLLRPRAGHFLVDDVDYWAESEHYRKQTGRRFGVLFQSGALWSSLTVGENVALPLQMFTNLDSSSIKRLALMKLALVGLTDAAHLYPSELSGGMRKRAGLARALALDPDILFFDEPSAGLDPVTSYRLDELILNLREGLGATIVIVSHELPSLFSIADDGVFLDATDKTAIAHGSPSYLRDHCRHPAVQAFMKRHDITSSQQS